MHKRLFEDTPITSHTNLLTKDGEAYYLHNVFSGEICEDLFQKLMTSISWQQDQLYMFGKLITTSRKVAWIGDPNCSYTYSGVKKPPQPWTPELLFIKDKAEELAQCEFNSCLLNLYHNGSEGMGWHSDDEIELNPLAAIASISLGGERKFAFKHKLDKTGVSLFLENGSALIMHAPTQEFWNHSLLKTKKPVSQRINLTFRKILLEHD